MSSQSAFSPSNVTLGRPHSIQHVKSKYFCVMPIKRMEAMMLSCLVVVEKAGMTHSLSSGSTTFSSMRRLINCAKRPKSTL